MTTMEYRINRKKSKSGKRNVFFPSINGKRISRTNYTAKWEAVNFLKHIIETYGEEKVNSILEDYPMNIEHFKGVDRFENIILK